MRSDLDRFYGLAKRQTWELDDLPWRELPPVPEARGAAVRRARHRDLWRSLLTQQLQADRFAALAAAQFLGEARGVDAKLYYTTMLQDETRHTEAWIRLVEGAGGAAEADPHLDELAHLTLAADTIEEKVWLLQVFYEGLVIPRLRLLARSARGSLVADLCTRLAVDDGIHHGAGMAYEQRLLTAATPRTKRAIARLSRRMLPLFVRHMLWRPRERVVVGRAMRARDLQRIKGYVEDGCRLAASFGIELDLADADLAFHL
jgi:hypothetical protein